MSILLLIHTLVFILFWLTNTLFYTSVNDYLASVLGSHLDYISIFLIVSAVLGIWSAARLLLKHFGRRAGPAWLVTVPAILYVLFFYGSFALLFSQEPVQISRLGDLLQYFRLPIDTLLLAGLVWLLRRLLVSSHSRLTSYAVGLTLIVVTFGVLQIPPGNVYKSPPGTEPQNPPQLWPKPNLVAHRGAAMLAPENTLASAERAVQAGAYGLEGDIRISLDGTLFLMHDDTLQRTTNVAAVFPGREKQNAANFTFAELRKLSAGLWFVQEDHYGSIGAGLVSAADVERFKTEPVPSLAEILQVVKSKKLVFIFDLLAPPADHPYSSRFFDLCLQQIKDAGVDSQIWFLADGTEMVKVQAAAPGMALAAGIDPAKAPPGAALKAQGYSVVNAEYSLSPAAIQDYRGAGLRVNLWTVDEPWQFSRLWILGVNSTTTNNVQAFKDLTAPILAIPYTMYSYLWVLFGLIGWGYIFIPRSLFKGVGEEHSV